jgi:hypothetical protein
VSATSRPLFYAPARGRQAVLSPTQRRLLTGARGLANLFDDKFSVLGFRFGLDAIVGLVPGIGDLISAGASAYLLLVGIQLRLPPTKLLRMAFNAGTDLLMGLVPFLGDVGDAVFKSHLRNLRIIEEHVARVEGRRR